MAAKLKPCITEKQFFPATVKNLSSLKGIEKIKAKLSPLQQEQFEASCFGKLFGMPAMNFSSQLVHHLVLRQADHPEEEELWFVIGEKATRFSQTEFALITGLNCGPIPSQDELVEMTRSTRIRDEYFDGQQTISIKLLEQRFLRCADEEDTFKLALVYFLETVLLPRNHDTSINLHWLSLVDDLEVFNKFPWGKECYMRTLISLKKPVKAKLELDRKKKNVNKKSRFHYTLYGFPYAFQVWSYEAIPLLGSKYAKKMKKKGNVIPRILCWNQAQYSKYEDLQKYIFSVKNLDVKKTLRASAFERRQDYMSSILEVTDVLDKKYDDIESEDSDGGYSDIDEVSQNDEVDKSANSVETVEQERERERASEATVNKENKRKEKKNYADANVVVTKGKGREKMRKKRANEFLSPSKKRKTVTTESVSLWNPTHGTDTKGTTEVLQRCCLQVHDHECPQGNNISTGNGDTCDVVTTGQVTEEHESLSTPTQPERSNSDKPSLTDPKNCDSDTLVHNEAYENAISLHLIVTLDAILQHQLRLDFRQDEQSQLNDDEQAMTRWRSHAEVVELSDDD